MFKTCMDSDASLYFQLLTQCITFTPSGYANAKTAYSASTKTSHAMKGGTAWNSYNVGRKGRPLTSWHSYNANWIPCPFLISPIRFSKHGNEAEWRAWRNAWYMDGSSCSIAV